MSIKNECQFIGNAGKDPEITATQGGMKIAKLSIAVTSGVKKGDVWEDETTWINLKAFKQKADLIEKYIKKGSKIAVSCKYTNSVVEQSDGTKSYYHDFIINEIEFMSSKAEKSEPSASYGSNGYGGSAGFGSDSGEAADPEKLPF